MFIIFRKMRLSNILKITQNIRNINHANVTKERLWQPTIGLEIHAQINSQTKLFSGTENKFSSQPNCNVSNFDAAMPGTLPALNKQCVKAAISTALALNCTVNKTSYFDRKHYFYSDLPQGYQITQWRKPIAVNGCFHYPSNDGKEVKSIGIQQVQIESDSGKSMHGDENNISLIDLNRVDVGLMEIVTEPSLTSAEDACSFVHELHMTLQYLGTCLGRMEEGQFRVDVNISLGKIGDPLGTRAEIKNINGLKHIYEVIRYEIKRQSKILENGKEVLAETRGFDPTTGITTSMRNKELAKQDYRFMPEPNLLPLIVYDDNDLPLPTNTFINIDDIKRQLPMLPVEIRKTLVEKYSLTFDQVEFLLSRNYSMYFINVLERQPDLLGFLVWDWMRINLTAYLDQNRLELHQCPISELQLADLLILLQRYEINSSDTMRAFNLAIEQKKSPLEIVEEKGWKYITDIYVITKLCEKAIDIFEQEEPVLFNKYNPAKRKLRSNKTVLSHLQKHVHSFCGNDIKPHTKLVHLKLIELLNKKFST